MAIAAAAPFALAADFRRDKLYALRCAGAPSSNEGIDVLIR